MLTAASPPSSARASKKSSGNVDIFKIIKLSREKKSPHPPKEDHRPTEGERKKL
jgi:hypothetical protein